MGEIVNPDTPAVGHGKWGVPGRLSDPRAFRPGPMLKVHGLAINLCPPANARWITFPLRSDKFQ